MTPTEIQEAARKIAEAIIEGCEPDMLNFTQAVESGADLIASAIQQAVEQAREEQREKFEVALDRELSIKADKAPILRAIRGR
jgi:hypothetical protein